MHYNYSNYSMNICIFYSLILHASKSSVLLISTNQYYNKIPYVLPTVHNNVLVASSPQD